MNIYQAHQAAIELGYKATLDENEYGSTITIALDNSAYLFDFDLFDNAACNSDVESIIKSSISKELELNEARNSRLSKLSSNANFDDVLKAW